MDQLLCQCNARLGSQLAPIELSGIQSLQRRVPVPRTSSQDFTSGSTRAEGRGRLITMRTSSSDSSSSSSTSSSCRVGGRKTAGLRRGTGTHVCSRCDGRSRRQPLQRSRVVRGGGGLSGISWKRRTRPGRKGRKGSSSGAAACDAASPARDAIEHGLKAWNHGSCPNAQGNDQALICGPCPSSCPLPPKSPRPYENESSLACKSRIPRECSYDLARSYTACAPRPTVHGNEAPRHWIPTLQGAFAITLTDGALGVRS